MSQIDVIIIGGGLAGLCCARHLHAEGIPFLLLEGSDGVGGRVRTDEHEGFLLDRGFQVLLTAYPEAASVLDYDALELCAFVPGAMVRKDGQFFRLTDPWRDSGSWLRNLFSPVGSLADKLRMSRMRSEVMGRSIEEIFDEPETSTRQALERRRFSPRMIDEFFKPWFGGIQLDPKLGASSRMFEFVFRMMSEGDVAVPALGMGRIPAQIAAALPAESVRLNARVTQIEGRTVTLAGGETLTAGSIVVATEGPESNRLLRVKLSVPSRSVTCLYFAAPEAPVDEPILVLSGSGRGLINSLTVMSNVSPEYAPDGQHLISVSVIGTPTRDQRSLLTNVTGQLKRWFGSGAGHWRFLRMYQIDHAQPVVVPLEWAQPVRVEPGIYTAGDYRATPSIQGAMESGRRAAEALIRDLRGEPDPEEEQPRAHNSTSAGRRVRKKPAASEEIDPEDEPESERELQD
jgi:phytoene dehydrogenase-like protein